MYGLNNSWDYLNFKISRTWLSAIVIHGVIRNHLTCFILDIVLAVFCLIELLNGLIKRAISQMIINFCVIILLIRLNILILRRFFRRWRATFNQYLLLINMEFIKFIIFFHLPCKHLFSCQNIFWRMICNCFMLIILWNFVCY